MNGRTPTPEQVVADAGNARQQLAALDHQLQSEIDAIVFTAFKGGRPLSSDDIEKRKQLRATQMEVRDQFNVLSFVTLQRLDDTDEVSQLLHQMNTINAGLQDDFRRLKKIKRYAAIIAGVTDAVAKATEKLAVIAAKGLS
ncbi:MAG: hypothetical protein R3D05_02415 [Dongiaceae bacterium]